MSMTTQDTKYHRMYEAMSDLDRDAIDLAYNMARKALCELLEGDWKPNNCDPAEALVAAIARYVHESRVATELGTTQEP